MRKSTPLLAVLAAACVSVGKSVLDTSFQTAPVERDDVFVYVAGDSVPEHTCIALLDAKGNTDWTDEETFSTNSERKPGNSVRTRSFGVTREPGPG